MVLYLCFLFYISILAEMGHVSSFKVNEHCTDDLNGMGFQMYLVL